MQTCTLVNVVLQAFYCLFWTFSVKITNRKIIEQLQCACRKRWEFTNSMKKCWNLAKELNESWSNSNNKTELPTIVVILYSSIVFTPLCSFEAWWLALDTVHNIGYKIIKITFYRIRSSKRPGAFSWQTWKINRGRLLEQLSYLYFDNTSQKWASFGVSIP